MAEINISNLGGGGGGTLTLTTTGTGGASTYVAGVLNIPVYQSALTNPVTGTGTATRVAFWDSASSVSSSANLYWDNSNSFLGVGTATPGARLQVNGTGLLTATAFSVKDSGGTDGFTVADNGNASVRGVLTVTGSSASNSATLMGRTSAGEVTSVTLGTNLSFSGNTLNASGGSGSPAGSTGEVQFNNAGAFGASSNLFWNNSAAPTGQRLGIGTTSPGARLQITGLGTTSGTSSFLVQNSTPAESFVIRDDRSWAFSANGAINGINIGRGGGNQSTNLAFGSLALNSNTSGFHNLGLGANALNSCVNGSYNVAVGNSSLEKNNNNYSTAIGYRPAFNSTGTEVTAIGVESGFTNTSGSFWTAIGSTAGYFNTTGSNWVAIGYQSGRQNTTGDDWVAIGYQAARFQADGTSASQFFRNSTYIGSGTRATNGTAGSLTSNETVIGYQAAGLGTNSTVIGSASTTRTHFFGNTTIGGTTAAAFTQNGRLHVRGSTALSGTNALLIENSTPSTLFQIGNNGATTLNGTLAQNGTVTMSDGSNIVVGSTNGTKIGTATTQKIGFYNASPIVRPDTGVAEAAFLENAGGTAVNDDSTFGGYTIRQVVQALQNLGLLA